MKVVRTKKKNEEIIEDYRKCYNILNMKEYIFHDYESEYRIHDSFLQKLEYKEDEEYYVLGIIHYPARTLYLLETMEFKDSIFFDVVDPRLHFEWGFRHIKKPYEAPLKDSGCLNSFLMENVIRIGYKEFLWDDNHLFDLLFNGGNKMENLLSKELRKNIEYFNSFE